MERFAVDDIRAFAMLTRLSQESNTKLLTVAKGVIATRNQGDPKCALGGSMLRQANARWSGELLIVLVGTKRRTAVE